MSDNSGNEFVSFGAGMPSEDGTFQGQMVQTNFQNTSGNHFDSYAGAGLYSGMSRNESNFPVSTCSQMQSAFVKQEQYHSSGQICDQMHQTYHTGVKREHEDMEPNVYPESGYMYSSGTKRTTPWSAYGAYELPETTSNSFSNTPSAATSSQYLYQDAAQGYGLPYSGMVPPLPQFATSSFSSVPSNSPTKSQKSPNKRTKIIDPNAELIHEENLKIPKYIRTFELSGSISDSFLQIERQLNHVVNQLQFLEPVTHVYNPTVYAHIPHELYIRKYCNTKKEILFLGMNPGPFGMSQNGVPFGEVNLVKNFLKIEGPVEKPSIEHPKRPILGFDCTRSEVSGSRFWGFFQRISGTADQFFRHSFVHNYCPLALMTKTGKNVTPPQLPKKLAAILSEACDQALCDVVKLLGVRVLVGIGKYAQERAQVALRTFEPDLRIDIRTLMHPSPINPAANKGWDPIAERQLREMGVYDLIAADQQTD